MKYLIWNPATALCVTDAVTEKDAMRFTSDKKKAAQYTNKEDAEKILSTIKTRTGIEFELLSI